MRQEACLPARLRRCQGHARTWWMMRCMVEGSRRTMPASASSRAPASPAVSLTCQLQSSWAPATHRKELVTQFDNIAMSARAMITHATLKLLQGGIERHRVSGFRVSDDPGVDPGSPAVLLRPGAPMDSASCAPAAPLRLSLRRFFAGAICRPAAVDTPFTTHRLS